MNACPHCGRSMAGDADRRRKYCGTACATDAKRGRDRLRHAKPYDPTSDQAARSICPVGAFWCGRCRQFHPVENAVMRHGRPLKCKDCKHDEHVRLAIKHGRRPPVRNGHSYGPNPWATLDGAYRCIVEQNARDAWRHWLYQKAPDWWLDAYYQGLGKPWLDHRLSETQMYRCRYANDSAYRHREIARTRIKKGKRRQRRRVTDDHTVDYRALAAERDRCPYCSAALTNTNRTFDHLDPLSVDGIHSGSNLVACCQSCNSRKKALPFVDWLKRLSPQDRKRAQRIYTQKRGAPPQQRGLAF